jgi:hypothetical protein
MTKTDTAALAAEMLATLANNVADTKAALEIAKMQPSPGFVFVWPEYWLGILVQKDGRSQAVGVWRATVTHRADKRVFTNGHDKKAVLMPLVEALEGALTHGLAVQADMVERVSKIA